jgi:hypothetical protein
MALSLVCENAGHNNRQRRIETTVFLMIGSLTANTNDAVSNDCQ